MPVFRFASTLSIGLALFSPTVAYSAALEDARAETAKSLSWTASDMPLCLPEITDAADMHVIYTDKGGDPVESEASDSRTRYSDIRVERTERPVFLVLSSYSSTVWRIDPAEGARIAGVYLTSGYEPMVIGLPEGVPVGRASFQTPQNSRKGTYCHLPGDLSPEQIRAKGETVSVEAMTASFMVNRLERKLAAAGGTDPDLSLKLSAMKTKAKAANAARNEHRAYERRLKSKPIRLDLGKRLASSDRVGHFVAAMAEVAPVDLVAYQRSKRGEAFTVSDEAAAAYRARLSGAVASLAALEMPDFPILGSDAPRLAAPEELTPGESLAYLADKGYLQTGGPAPGYFCQKRNLAILANDEQPQWPCAVILNGPIYTILGPIVLPPDLCGGSSVIFLLAPGVPEPEGTSCHSPVYRLDTVPCGNDVVACMSSATRP